MVASICWNTGTGLLHDNRGFHKGVNLAVIGKRSGGHKCVIECSA